MTIEVEDEAVPFGRVLRAWSDAGEAPPAAIIAAIVHDLAEQTRHQPGDPSDRADPERVEIRNTGLAWAREPIALSGLVDLMELGLHGLAPGRTGDLMPPSARSGLERFRDWDGGSEDGLLALQSWLRSQFGPLPSESEVILCCRASSPMDPQAPTVPPANKTLKTRWREASQVAIQVPEGLRAPRPASSSPDFTGPPDPRTLKARWREASQAAIRVPEGLRSPQPAPSSPDLTPPPDRRPLKERWREAAKNGSSDVLPLPVPDLAEDGGSGAGSQDLSGSRDDHQTVVDYAPNEERRVVRKQPSRDKPVSLTRAPAARRSAAPQGSSNDSILVPADGGAVPGWWLVVLGIVIGVGAYLALT
jgi:hypothetical protein